MNDFFHSDLYIISISLLFFIDFSLLIIVSVWIGRNSFMKKIDMIFFGYSSDSGLRINLLDSSSYGLAMIFPKSYGKRVYKNVDISKINKKDKWPYILYTSILLFGIPVFILISFL